MEIGATLRQAREARKLTTDQVSRATRIPLHIIVAMEKDDWKQVPSGIFARGYLRAYAREVGLDGNALALRFQAEHAPPPPAEPEAEVPKRGRFGVGWPSGIAPEDAKRWLVWPALALLLIVAYVAGRSSVEEHQPQAVAAPVPAPVASSGSGSQDNRPVGTTAPSAPRDVPAPKTADALAEGGPAGAAPRPARPSAGPDAPLVVDVMVTRACWVAASTDGVRAIYRVLQPGERVQTRGRVMTFRVGDAGALQLSLDGMPARRLGTNGQVLTLRITRQNAESLLLPRS